VEVSQDELDETLRSVGGPAYAVDHRGRLVGWNREVARLLGYTPGDVLGRACCRVISGRDVFGNPFCEPDCQVQRLVRSGYPIRRFEMDVRTASGGYLRVGCTVLVVRLSGARGPVVIHLLRPVAEDDASWRPPAPGVRRLPPKLGGVAHGLTPREWEVLCQMAEGRGTKEIATELGIASATVRTHVQNLLAKLGVHSRLEAIALAVREGWL
jgi:PAS domain S-box-containing protein